MANEKSKANADWCNKSGAVLLGCEHKDGEDQQCCQKHLDEEAASDTCVCGQRGCDGKFLSRNGMSASLFMIAEQSMGRHTFGNSADTMPALAMAPMISARTTTARRV